MAINTSMSCRNKDISSFQIDKNKFSVFFVFIFLFLWPMCLSRAIAKRNKKKDTTINLILRFGTSLRVVKSEIGTEDEVQSSKLAQKISGLTALSYRNGDLSSKPHFGYF